MDYREELFKALTAGVDGVFRDKSIDALVEVCKAARKEGYNAGFENGNISDGTFDEKVKEAYENGLNVAWECARKIFSMPVYDVNEIFPECQANICEDVSALEAIERIKEYEKKQKEPVFNVGDRVRTLVDEDKLGAERFPVGTIGEVTDFGGNAIEVSVDGKKWYYHKKDIELANDVILVGDEVYLLDANYHGVVTAVWKNCGVVKTERLTQSGKLACDDAKDLHRTGRRFPEIANILKQMQEGNE